MSLTQDFNSLFAPMDQKYCELFHGISVFYFLIMVLAIFNFVFLFRDIKKNKYQPIKVLRKTNKSLAKLLESAYLKNCNDLFSANTVYQVLYQVFKDICVY